jgi:hypothetical protein
MKIFGSSKNSSSNKPSSNPYIINRVPWFELESVTNSLIKFCTEHEGSHTSSKIEHIKASIEALKKGDIEAAKIHYKDMGIFQKEGFFEWYPNITFPNETREYVNVIFQSLIQRWAHLMLKIFDYKDPC